MTSSDDLDLKQWADDWKAAPYDVESAEQIRRYVAQRTGLFWSFAVMDFVIAGVTLPLLTYLAIVTENAAERLAMAGLSLITVATVLFGWWNRRGVLRSHATTIADYVSISEERLRRMRMAWTIAWVVWGAQVAVFTVWVWNRLYAGATPPSVEAERFGWGWLAGMAIVMGFALVHFGRWLRRDEERFASLRGELGAD
jgi:hypothetical protein